MLETRDLTKRFGGTTAVDGVSLAFSPGEMVGVIGRSGAGKSTLLRLLNRLETASEGAILHGGRDVTRLTGARLRTWQRDCAMIFQQFNLVPRLDVLTNVMLGRLNGRSTALSLMKIFTDAERAQALTALERLGIAGTALQPAGTLSGGQQQRVAIARALMQRPKIILADEPIASLDPMNAEIVMRSLEEINVRDGITVVCNLHTLDTARTYCRRVVGMLAGRVVFDGPAQALTPERVREVYGVAPGAALSEGITSTAMPQAEPPDPRSAEPERRVLEQPALAIGRPPPERTPEPARADAG